MDVKTIAIGGDHAGVEYKAAIIEWLEGQGITVHNFGTNSTDSVDYPDFARPVAQSVAQGQAQLGILICGSGNGVCMTANKNPEIRAALTWNNELAALARQHNNANVLCIPARFVPLETALSMTQTFLSTAFEGGRHERRVDKITA